MIPGPLSVTVIRKRVAWLAAGAGPPLATGSTLTTTSGRMPASSHASSALSTASLTQVRSALRGLSNPRRCRFLVKNSETEISRWRAPISMADPAGRGGGAGGGGVAGGLLFGGAFVRLFICQHTNKVPLADSSFLTGAGGGGRLEWARLEPGPLFPIDGARRGRALLRHRVHAARPRAEPLDGRRAAARPLRCHCRPRRKRLTFRHLEYRIHTAHRSRHRALSTGPRAAAHLAG